jgi:tripartite-type tricarboxylate transporter receptor subunit TctC
MGGQIDILFDHLAHSLPHVREGKIRAYAVTAAARSSSAPDISTVDEAGVPKLYVPSGTGYGRRRARRRTWSPSSMPP